MNPSKLLPFACLTLFLASGCGDPVPHSGLPPLQAAMTDDGKMYLLDSPKGVFKTLMNGHYYQARLSPDRTKVACVREGNFTVTIYDLDGNDEYTGKPKDIYNSQALSTSGTQGRAFFPTWSADGNKLFFLNENHLVVYDYQEKHTTVLFDFPKDQSGGLLPENGNMALSKDGGSLYLMLSQGADKVAFWRSDASGSSWSPLALADRSAIRDFRFPADLSEECIETLFGSKEHPVWDPAVSNDGRYYFYVEKGSGILAKDELKGYDRTQKTSFDVLTVGTSLFR